MKTGYILPALALLSTAVLGNSHYESHAHAVLRRAALAASSLTGQAAPTRFELARIRRRESIAMEPRDFVEFVSAVNSTLPAILSVDGIKEAFNPSSSRFPAAILLAVAAGVFAICITLLTIMCCCKRRSSYHDRPKNTPPTRSFQAPRPFHSKASSISSFSTFSEKVSGNGKTKNSGLAPSPMIEKHSSKFVAPRSPALPSSTHPSHADIGTSNSPPGPHVYDLRSLAPDSPQRSYPVRPSTPEQRRPVTPERPRPITPESRHLQVFNTPPSSPSGPSIRRFPLPIIRSPQMQSARSRESNSDSDYEDEDCQRPVSNRHATLNDGFVYRTSLPSLNATREGPFISPDELRRSPRES